MSNFWPGTNTPKSQGNAFDWRNCPSGIQWSSVMRQAVNARQPDAFGDGGTMVGLSEKGDALLAQKHHNGVYSRAGSK